MVKSSEVDECGEEGTYSPMYVRVPASRDTGRLDSRTALLMLLNTER